jgi:hypothetical protein
VVRATGESGRYAYAFLTEFHITDVTMCLAESEIYLGNSLRLYAVVKA